MPNPDRPRKPQLRVTRPHNDRERPPGEAPPAPGAPGGLERRKAPGMPPRCPGPVLLSLVKEEPIMAHLDDPTQPRSPSPVPQDHPCPLCDRPGVPFDVRVSALLDWLDLLEQTMVDVRKAAQELAS